MNAFNDEPNGEALTPAPSPIDGPMEKFNSWNLRVGLPLLAHAACKLESLELPLKMVG